MNAILFAVTPLFAVIVLGFVAGRVRLLDDRGIAALIAFVFNIALPPLLFRLLANAAIPGGAGLALMGGYLATGFGVFLGGALLGAWAFRLDIGRAAIQGFGSAFPNGVFLGLPLLLSLYGEAGAAPALLLVIVDVMFFALVTLLLELGRARGGGDTVATVVRSLRALFTNPVVLSMLAGLAYRAAGFGLPALADESLRFLGQAATPTALFALGVTLGRRRLGGRLSQAAVMTATKLLLHPLAAWLVVMQIPGLDPLWRSVMVIFAACPVGANVYIFAQRYDVAVDTASSAIVLSTAAAMATLLLVPWLLAAAG